MKLSRIAEITRGDLIGDDRDVSVRTSIDSRSVEDGGIFAALHGEHVDGHLFVSTALANGAAVALVSEGVDASPVIRVDDVPVALGRLAAAHVAEHRDHLTIIAVTGSVGKTTTKDLLAGLLPGPTVASDKSLNNELGVPLTALRSDSATRFLVLEMGADKKGDLAYLTSLIAPDVAIVLAVGSAHLETFGSHDDVAQAKSELIAGLAKGGVAVLNSDDPRVAAMAPMAERVITFGSAGELRASDVELDQDGHPSFGLDTPVGSRRVTLGLVGGHHVHNALAAATAAWSVGMSPDDIARGLSGKRAVSPHRMNVVERADGVTIIDDSYNANPQSMAAGLQVLAQLARDRRAIAVLGPMLELGDASVNEHRRISALISTLGIDVVHLLGPIASLMACDGVECHVHSDLDGIRAALNEQVRSGDVLLFKSSNGALLYQLAEEWVS